MIIAPGASSPFPITVQTKRKTGAIDEHLTLFTDYPKQPPLNLNIIGQVNATVVTTPSAHP